MKKSGFRIILALVMVMVLAIGSASAINASNPAMAKSVQILNVDATQGFYISYSWEKYAGWSYTVTIKRVVNIGVFEEAYNYSYDFGKRTDSFTFGPAWVPAISGVTVYPTQSYVITLQLFKKSGDVSTIELSTW